MGRTGKTCWSCLGGAGDGAPLPLRVFEMLAGCEHRVHMAAGPRGRWTIVTAEPRRVSSFDGFSGFDIGLLEALLLAEDCGFPQRGTGAGSEPVFTGGALGFLSYDLARMMDTGVRWTSGGRSPDWLGVPAFWFGIFDWAYVYDNRERLGYRVGRHPVIDGAIEAAAEQAIVSESERAAVGIRSNFSRSSFEAAVERVRELIAAGDIYQMNLAQRFEISGLPEFGTVARRLIDGNPAPYSAFLEIGKLGIASASPECFLSIGSGRVLTRPIKGTRPRGRGLDDAQQIAALSNCSKERAELLMIVDLERNDLGRVAEVGSVVVEALYGVESYSTVHHLVGEVTARLPDDLSLVQLLQATFPGGSITGAPKVRAMEVIDELEPDRRGLFTGCIGYVNRSGGAQFNIAIRTLVQRGNAGSLHAGAGIVWDSQPSREYRETLAKARGVLQCLPGFTGFEMECDDAGSNE